MINEGILEGNVKRIPGTIAKMPKNPGQTNEKIPGDSLKRSRDKLLEKFRKKILNKSQEEPLKKFREQITRNVERDSGRNLLGTPGDILERILKLILEDIPKENPAKINENFQKYW